MKSQGWDPCKMRPEMCTHREKGHVRTQKRTRKRGLTRNQSYWYLNL